MEADHQSQLVFKIHYDGTWCYNITKEVSLSTNLWTKMYDNNLLN